MYPRKQLYFIVKAAIAPELGPIGDSARAWGATGRRLVTLVGGGSAHAAVPRYIRCTLGSKN